MYKYIPCRAALAISMWSARAAAEGLALLVAENKAGYFGVHLNKPGQPKPYQAKVRRGGKQVSLGYFATAEEAALCVARSPEGQEAANRAHCPSTGYLLPPLRHAFTMDAQSSIDVGAAAQMVLIRRGVDNMTLKQAAEHAMAAHRGEAALVTLGCAATRTVRNQQLGLPPHEFVAAPPTLTARELLDIPDPFFWYDSNSDRYYLLEIDRTKVHGCKGVIQTSDRSSRWEIENAGVIDHAGSPYDAAVCRLKQQIRLGQAVAVKLGFVPSLTRRSVDDLGEESGGDSCRHVHICISMCT